MSGFELSTGEFRALYDRVKHLSRQGPADRLGALNNISSAQVAAAASSVWRGRAVSVAAPIGSKAGPDNPDPAVHQMIHTGISPGPASGVSFDDLVAVCKELNRWSFLCVIAPLRLPAATGSPVNPIAIF
jgi:hypothetical protein